MGTIDCFTCASDLRCNLPQHARCASDSLSCTETASTDPDRCRLYLVLHSLLSFSQRSIRSAMDTLAHSSVDWVGICELLLSQLVDRYEHLAPPTIHSFFRLSVW